jgi:hypothetical protein
MKYTVQMSSINGEYALPKTFDLPAADHLEIAASLKKIGEQLGGKVRILQITVDRGGRYPATVYVADSGQASYNEFVDGRGFIGSPERVTSPDTGASCAAWRLHRAGDVWFAA